MLQRLALLPLLLAAPAAASGPCAPCGRWLGSMDGLPLRVIVSGTPDALQATATVSTASSSSSVTLLGHAEDEAIFLEGAAPSGRTVWLSASLEPGGDRLRGALERADRPDAPLSLTRITHPGLEEACMPFAFGGPQGADQPSSP